MIPPLIVQEALDKRINLIAISDHNASANVLPVIRAAQGTGLTVLPGIEVQTKEEVHVLCLFDTIEQIVTFQACIDAHLPDFTNDPNYFGEQFVVDETGEFLRREQQLLLTSVDLPIEDVFRTVNKLGGLPIPAHIDRKAYGLIAVLGLIPPDLPIEAVEISHTLSPKQAKSKFPSIKNYPILINGDAHRLDEIIGSNVFHLKEPTIREIRKALQASDNRSFHIRTI
jgi:3',5'-nucleoside bisphosphate phosphatase